MSGLRKSAGVFLAAASICAAASPARAQGDVVERHVAAVPGRDARVDVFADIRADCSAGPLPTIRLVVMPAHGTVTVKRGTLKATNLKQCLATEVPAIVAFYRATADFVGADSFELEVGMPDGRKRHERVQVTVSKSGGDNI